MLGEVLSWNDRAIHEGIRRMFCKLELIGCKCVLTREWCLFIPCLNLH